MKIINNISKYLLGLVTIITVSSCSDQMDEITSLILDRNYAPVELTAKVVNKTNVKLTWVKSNADSYTIEVFQDDSLTFAGTPVKTITNIQASNIPYTVNSLQGETNYSFRVKAVTKDDASRDSKWSTAYVETEAENILSAVNEETDITATTVTLNWPAGQTATSIVATNNDSFASNVITHTITADEIAAGKATISGLTPETNYTLKLYNNTKTRGTVKVKTAIDLGGATLVKAGSDLKTCIDNANDGDVLALMPGTYPINTIDGNMPLNKSIAIKSVRSYDKAIIQGGFQLSNGAALSLTQLVLDGNNNTTIKYVADYKTAGKFGDLTIEGCDVKGYTGGVYYVNIAADITNLKINNSIIHNISTASDFMDCRLGAIHNLTFTNNTVYAISCRDFFRYDNKASSFPGVTPYINVDHNTLDGLGSVNKGVFYVRFMGTSIAFTNNIVSNSTGLFCKFAPTSIPNFSGNNYYNSPNFVEATDDKTNVGITVYDNTGTSYNPSYADYANHDFTVKSEDLKSSKTGDPRWIK
ncbi:MAG: DUF4957 domain-containing protein [Prevotella sp.]|nr:DUF4957 domain-containing protein [Prevotella sp.]